MAEAVDQTVLDRNKQTLAFSNKKIISLNKMYVKNNNKKT